MHSLDSSPYYELYAEMVRPETVEAILVAQDPEKDAPPLDATSWTFLSEDVAEDPNRGEDALLCATRLARCAVAEHMIRWLGTFAMREAHRPGSEREEVVVAELVRGQARFTGEFIRGLVDRFGLFDYEPRSPTEQATSFLAHDLHHWVRDHCSAAQQFGLKIGRKAGVLSVLSPRRSTIRNRRPDPS